MRVFAFLTVQEYIIICLNTIWTYIEYTESVIIVIFDTFWMNDC